MPGSDRRDDAKPEGPGASEPTGVDQNAAQRDDATRSDARTIRDPGTPSSRGGRAESGRHTPLPIRPGAKVFGGRYEVVREIESGGMGTVFEALDHNFNPPRVVAVKTIKTQGIGPDELPEFLRLFNSEAGAAGQLIHDGIVSVFDHDPYADEPYIVMPYIEGGTVKKVLKERRVRREGPIDPADAIELGIQVADALHYAHTKIQAHRDIKPGNIFRDERGRYKVGDFGIARVRKPGGATRTRLHDVVGTPEYMAPEQWYAPADVDGRADLFALCVVLFEALTGDTPFVPPKDSAVDPEDPDVRAKVESHFLEKKPRFGRAVPADLARVIAKGLEIDPRKRFQDCAALADELRKIQRKIASGRVVAEETTKWGGSAKVIAALAALAGLVGLAWVFILPGIRGDDLSRARAAAAQAQADVLAAKTWNEAEAKRADAVRLESRPLREEALELYGKAVKEAWSLAAYQAGSALEGATAVRAAIYAPDEFANAESARARGEELQVDQPGSAVEQLLLAKEGYAKARQVAADKWGKTLRERHVKTRAKFDEIIALLPPPERPTDLDDVIVNVGRALEATNLEEADRLLAALEGRAVVFAEKADQIILANRRQVAEEARGNAVRAQRELEQARNTFPIGSQVLAQEIREAAETLATAQRQLGEGESDRKRVDLAAELFAAAARRFEDLTLRLAQAESADLEQRVAAAVEEAEAAQMAAVRAAADESIPEFARGGRDLEQAKVLQQRDARAALQLAQQATAAFGTSEKMAEVGGTIRDAQTLQTEARQLGADAHPTAKVAYLKGVQAIELAKTQLRTDPPAAAEAAERGKIELSAAIEAVKLGTIEIAAERAIEAARAAQAEAKQAGAPTLAQEEYLAAERLIETAEEQRRGDPNGSRRQADTAREAFASAALKAQAETKAQAVEHDRQFARKVIAEAEAAQRQTQEMGGEGTERYQIGTGKLGKAKELQEGDPVAARVQAEGARVDFEAALGIVDRERQIALAREAIGAAEQASQLAKGKATESRDGARLLMQALNKVDADPLAAQRLAKEAEAAFVAAAQIAEQQAEVRRRALHDENQRAAADAVKEAQKAEGVAQKADAPSLAREDYDAGLTQLRAATDVLESDSVQARENAQSAHFAFVRATSRAQLQAKVRTAADAIAQAEAAQRSANEARTNTRYRLAADKLSRAVGLKDSDPAAALALAQEANADFDVARQIGVTDIAITKAQQAQQDMKGQGVESKEGVQALIQATKLKEKDPVKGQQLAQEAEKTFVAAGQAARRQQEKRLTQEAIDRAQKARQVTEQTAATGEDQFRQGEDFLKQAAAAKENDPSAAQRYARSAEAAFEVAVAQVRHKQHVAAARKELDAARQAQREAEEAEAPRDALGAAADALREAEDAIDTDPVRAAARAQQAAAASTTAARTARKGQTRDVLAQAERTRATAQQRRANVLAKASFDEGEKLLRTATTAVEQDWQIAQENARRATAAFEQAVRIVEDLTAKAGQALADAKARQTEAKDAQADLWPSAKKQYREGEQQVGQAETAKTQGAPQESLDNAQKAETSFAHAARLARDEALKNPTWMQTRDEALHVMQKAEAARDAAKKTGAANPQLAAASKRFQDAERQLSIAKDGVDLDPKKTLDAAQAASVGFGEAERLVAAALVELEQKIDQARGQVAAAQRKVDALAGASQFASYKNAQKVLSEGDARRAAKTSEALIAAGQSYDSARKLFEKALAVAKGPVQSVSPAADSVVEVDTGVRVGSGARFNVELSYPEARVSWLLDGQRAPGSDGGRSWEYRPAFEDTAEDHVVKVIVEGEEGKTVNKQWTARVVAANDPPKIVAIAPSTAAVAFGKSVTFSATVEDPDTDRGDRVTCKWNVNGQPREDGQCGFQWKPDEPGAYKIELVAVDRRGASTRKERQFRVLPPADQLVDEWLADECRRIERNYEEKLGDKVKCRWKGREIAGELPEVTVSYVRVDEFLTSGDTKELPKKVALRCAEGNCVAQ